MSGGVKGIVFLVNKATLHVSYAGPVPAVHGTITGLANVDYSVLRDLGVVFGDDYKNLGFLTEDDAIELGVMKEHLASMKDSAYEIGWNNLEPERAARIQAQQWRIDRYQQMLLLGKEPVEDIKPVLLYCQAIRDLPNVYPNPFVMVWPTVPA